MSQNICDAAAGLLKQIDMSHICGSEPNVKPILCTECSIVSAGISGKGMVLRKTNLHKKSKTYNKIFYDGSKLTLFVDRYFNIKMIDILNYIYTR